MNMKQAIRCASAVSVALMLSTAYAAGDTQTAQPMTGKEKATAIGAGTGAVAGAVVGGPVGAVVGAGVGAYVGHEGTDANGKVSSAPARAIALRSRTKSQRCSPPMAAGGRPRYRRWRTHRATTGKDAGRGPPPASMIPAPPA